MSKELLYRNIIKTTTDGFWLVGPDGQILDVNEQYEKMSGYSRAELLKMNIPQLEAIESEDETAAHIKKIKETGWDRFESIHKKKDGSNYDVEVSTTFFPENNSFVAFLRDVSEAKKAQNALFFTQFAIDNSADSAFWSNKEGRFVYVNEAACKSLGYSREELMSMTVSDFDLNFPPEAWSDHWEDLKEKGSI